jgi:protein-L-isoaspartate(D-aspartate) O-methyltransferase
MAPIVSDIAPDELRRRYAAETMRSGGIDHPRVEAAFAAAPREAYLAPPPWTIFAPGGLFMTETADPAELYQDVLVVLDRERGINNGQPSLHAAWLAALDPQPGEVALHIGAGTGYYTAILAALVAPGGAVHAYEIEPHLAGLAQQNLAALETVTVHPVSGVGAALPASDVVYVNASAAAPDVAWLRALEPGGRLIFPWQPPGRRSGVTLQVTRQVAGYRVAATLEVAFIACVGATARPAGGDGPDVSEVMRTRSLWLVADRPPDDSAVVVYDEVWFSTEPV